MTKGAVVLFLLSAPMFAQEASIAGIAVDSSSGRPLPGVHVRVFSIAAQNIAASYGAASDREGRFSIAKIPAGSYFYMGELAGYLTVRKSGPAAIPLPSVTIKAGEALSDFKLEMTPRANISGRVVDEEGDPVQGAQVQLTPVSPDAPTAFSLTGNMASSDDRGEYRVAAGPGKYYVQASVFGSQRASELRTDGTTPAQYAPTWYPSSLTRDRAQVVEVAAGGDVRGIEIRLTGARAAATAEWRVTGPPEEVARAQILITVREQNGMYTDSTTPAADGRFSVRVGRPGNYRVIARSSGPHPMQSQAVDFTDTSTPASVELRLAPGTELAASIAVDRGQLPPAKRAVHLTPSGGGQVAAGDTGDDGIARVTVFPGTYRVTVQPLPENAYIRAAELDGAKAEPENLDLTRGGSRLKLTVSLNGARISGSILDKDGARITNTAGAVILLRDRTKPELIDEDHYNRVGADGSYTFKAIAPGKYWLLALDVFRSGNFGGPEMLKKYADLAEEIEVKEGDRIRKDLRVVTKEAIDAKSK